MILATYITTFLIGWTLISIVFGLLLMTRNRIERRQKHRRFAR